METTEFNIEALPIEIKYIGEIASPWQKNVQKSFACILTTKPENTSNGLFLNKRGNHVLIY